MRASRKACIDSVSARTVSLTNKISNGNFASTSNWTGNGSSFTVASNEGSFLADSANDTLGQNNISITNGHKYYYAGWVQAPSSAIKCNFSDNSVYGVSIPHSGSGNYEFLSSRYDAITTTSSASMYIIVDSRTSAWTTIKCKYATLIDLTAAFGAGSEPTKEQMDTLMDQFTNKWLNGTQTATYYW